MKPQSISLALLGLVAIVLAGCAGTETTTTTTTTERQQSSMYAR
ncbi:MAG: hypothetical protein ABR589_01005 [Chthoniobacterales bacterium]